MLLSDILSACQRELENRKHTCSLERLQYEVLGQSSPVPLSPVLRGDRIQLIAEIKKASPSKGLLCSDFDYKSMAQKYAVNGAAAISVLTETSYFQGNLLHLRAIKTMLGDKKPLIRKDFIVDSYQVYESRAYGADALLLIVAILNRQMLKILMRISHQLGMECLVEVHNEKEIEIALSCGAEIIGINNRDLNSFEVDLATTERLRPLIPDNIIIVSESGIRNRADIEKLWQLGVNAILIGESLVTAPDIPARMKELIS
jgi:indole-3-glycerol phosphate synthase